MTESRRNRSLVFWKLDGAGNDFIALDNWGGELPEGNQRAALIRTLCDRRSGVGTDGALVLERPRDPGTAHVGMRYYNRDGGEAEMCGNGARCHAVFAYHLGAAPARGMRIETMAGIQGADVLDDGSVCLALPDVPPLRHVGAIDAKFGTGAGESWRGEADFLRVGVPHAVVWVEDLDALPVDSLGRALRHHSAFAPAGANINFASPAASSRVFVRTYERGVERETLACGTGSVATAISAVLAGRATPPVAVRVRGGVDLLIDFELLQRNGARSVTLTGPARILFRAETQWNPKTGEVFFS